MGELMAHEIFEEPLLLVLWLIVTIVLLGAVLLSGMETSKLLTAIYLKIYNNKVSTLINIASAMPEGSEMYLPVKPDYQLGSTSIKIHQSFSSRYIEVTSKITLRGESVMELNTITPFTGIFATHRDPVIRDKYISINYLYETDQGFGYISPYSGAFISKAEAVHSETPLSLEKIENTQIIYKDKPTDIQELFWVYDATGKDYIHLKKQDGLLIIEPDS